MKLMVIDGNSIVNRAFYGVSQNLSTREGLPTNANCWRRSSRRGWRWPLI